MRRFVVPVAVGVVVVLALAVVLLRGTSGAAQTTAPERTAAGSASSPTTVPADGAPRGEGGPGAASPAAPPRPSVGPTAPAAAAGDLQPEIEAPAPRQTWSRSPQAVTASVAPSIARGPSTGEGAVNRLEIPSVGITAPLMAAEITGGEYAVPPDPASVGVHRGGVEGLAARLGPRPGTLLLAGHVSVGRVRGALWPLHTLEPGAELLVGGRRFRALRLDIHRADALPADMVRTDGPERLVLVTCTGPIVSDAGRRSYRDNLVVTAVPA